MIVINERYYVETDPLNYILKRKGSGTNRNGEPIKTDSTLGFYSSLEDCIKASIEDTKKSKFSDSDYSLEEALLKIKEINNDLLKELKRIKED